MDQWMDQFRKKILQQLDMSGEISDEELMEQIGQQMELYAREHLITLGQREKLQQQMFHSFRKLDVLQELLEQQDVTEIMVNGTKHIFYEKQGELYPWDRQFESLDKLENVIRQIAGLGNKTINESEPIVDTRLSDGSRVNIVMAPAALDGPCITIRKFSRDIMSLGRIVELGTISQEIKSFLELLVQAGYNIFISGGTGSGKTTFLNALSQAIPAKERVITIEDSAELQLQGVKNLVRLEARMSNGNGAGEISIRDLIRTSLRMRPDRIIVGEVRGPEALELLQANNTGHSGGMSTGHANSCEDMLSRLAVMVLMGKDIPLYAVRGQIAAGFDILIHLGRMRDRSRKVLQICEVTGMRDGEIQLQTLYEFVEEKMDGNCVKGRWNRIKSLSRLEKLQAKGLKTKLEELYQQEITE